MGRPAKGDRAMTAAERQQAYRQRQRDAGIVPASRNVTKLQQELGGLRARVAELEAVAAATKAAVPVTLRDAVYRHVPDDQDQSEGEDQDPPEWDDLGHPQWDAREGALNDLVERMLPWVRECFYFGGNSTAPPGCDNPAGVDAISAIVGVDLRASIDEQDRARAAEEAARQARRRAGKKSA